MAEAAGADAAARARTMWCALADWTDPQPPAQTWQALVPQVDADGNEIAGIRLPDIAVPLGILPAGTCIARPMPEGELADRDGTYLAFTTERYSSKDAYGAQVQAVVDALVRDRLLLSEDATAYIQRARG